MAVNSQPCPAAPHEADGLNLAVPASRWHLSPSRNGQHAGGAEKRFQASPGRPHPLGAKAFGTQDFLLPDVVS